MKKRKLTYRRTKKISYKSQFFVPGLPGQILVSVCKRGKPFYKWVNQEDEADKQQREYESNYLNSKTNKE